MIVDGTIECWGWNLDGEIAQNGTIGIAATPLPVAGLSGVTALTAGDHLSCALLVDGTARCWGLNVAGALGDDTEGASSTPVVVDNLTNATEIDQGVDGSHTCALLADGTGACWGYNGYGEVGHGSYGVPSLIPGLVDFLSGARLDDRGRLPLVRAAGVGIRRVLGCQRPRPARQRRHGATRRSRWVCST